MVFKFDFRGFMAPVFTPFHEDEEKSLNLEIIQKYARFLNSNDIKGVLVGGTSGEATSLSVEEREKVAEAWIEATRETGQCVVVQVGGTSLKQVRRLASHAERSGAAAIMCLADLFHRPKTCDDLINYLGMVSKHAPETPLLYYHLPDFTGINVNMRELFQKANHIKNFCGIKYTSNDLYTGSGCLAVAQDKHVIFIGSDSMLLPAFSVGFDSAIGTTLNIMPKENFEIYRAVRSGNLQQALKIQNKLNSAITSITKHGTWVGTMKSAMNLLTPIKVGPVREPLSSLTEKEAIQLLNELKMIDVQNVKL